MHKLEKTITTKTNITHNPLNKNTICLCRIVDWLSSYTPTNVQQLSSRKFSLIWEINVAGKPSLKLSNPKLATSNDHNFWSAQRNPTFFGALEISHQGAPFDTTHSQLSHTTRERDHKNPHGLTTPKKNIVLWVKMSRERSTIIKLVMHTHTIKPSPLHSENLGRC